MPQARKNPQQYVAIGPSQVKKRMFHDRQQFLFSNTRSLGSDMEKNFEMSEMFFNFHSVENIHVVYYGKTIFVYLYSITIWYSSFYE